MRNIFTVKFQEILPQEIQRFWLGAEPIYLNFVPNDYNTFRLFIAAQKIKDLIED